MFDSEVHPPLCNVRKRDTHPEPVQNVMGLRIHLLPTMPTVLKSHYRTEQTMPNLTEDDENLCKATKPTRVQVSFGCSIKPPSDSGSNHVEKTKSWKS